MADRPTAQVPGVYHRRIGDIVVTTLSDGYSEGSFRVFRDTDPAEAEALLVAANAPNPPVVSVNCFLLRTGTRTALVDNGAADAMGPTMGRLFQSLNAAGVDPSEVDTVIQTHLHPDHSNGLTTKDGVANFPNAELVVADAEVAHWSDDGAMAKANERVRAANFTAARTQIAPYRDRMRPAEGEVFPGVRAVPLAGHTPGHTGYVVESGGEALFIWGDICHVPDVQVPRPQTAMIFDVDPQEAIEARRRAFDMAASENFLVAGMHLNFPGFGRIDRAPDRDGHRLVYEPWRFAL